MVPRKLKKLRKKNGYLSWELLAHEVSWAKKKIEHLEKVRQEKIAYGQQNGQNLEKTVQEKKKL